MGPPRAISRGNRLRDAAWFLLTPRVQSAQMRTMARRGYHIGTAAALAAALAVPGNVLATHIDEDRPPGATEKLLAQVEYPVTWLGLDAQVVRALHRNDIYEIGTLVALGEDDLLKKSRLGPFSVGHIIDALDGVGLSLDKDLPPEATSGGKKSASLHRPYLLHKEREQWVAMVRDYATTLTPEQRERIVRLHRTALVHSRDDPELGERRFQVLMAQWVHLEDRQPLAKLGQKMLKRTKDGDLASGLIEAQVRELEHDGLYRLAVALNREALAQGLPITHTWQRAVATAKPRREAQPLTAATKKHRALIRPLLDQPKDLLHLPLPPFVPKDVISIAEVIRWIQDNPAYLTRRQRDRTNEILGSLDLSELGLEGVRLGLDMDVSWRRPRKKARVAAALSLADHEESVRPLTLEEVDDLSQRFAMQLGHPRGIRFLRLHTEGHAQQAIGDAEPSPISRERVRQLIRTARWKLHRWRDRQSIVTRAKRARRRTSTKSPRKGSRLE